jgi:tetratricopeptide (TPR) repeat protein
MRTLVVVAGLTVAFGALAPAAWAQGGYRPPDCDLPSGHFMVNSGVVYIKGASEESDPVKKESMLGNAERALTDALDRGQEDNPAVWYFLGRYFVLRNDPIGADSVFDRAAELAPQCADDIAQYRQILWVPTVNTAIEHLRTGDYQSAKPFLQQAWAIYSEDNLSPFYLAQIHYNERELDSALHYFKAVVNIGTADSTRLDNYNTALFNVGLVYTQEQQWDSAAAWLDRFRAEVDAEDPQALTTLARAVTELGDSARAFALYDTVLAMAPDLGYMDLLKTGESLFLAGQYEQAAYAFRLGLEKNPDYRPGLYNLVNSYLAIHNDVEQTAEEETATAVAMEEAAQRLVAVDPLSAESMRLLAAAYQMQQKDDSTLAVLERIEALPFEVSIDVLQPLEGNFVVQGRLANMGSESVMVPDLTFEFLDQDGNVLRTEILAGRELTAGMTEPFDLQVEGEDITAARYSAPE